MMLKSYLNNIKSALEQLYKNDSELFDSITNEMTYTFRIAKYLSDDLVEDEYKIDCEYHGMVKDKKFIRKRVGDNKIRPDIIYHKRSSIESSEDVNIFVIEVKKGYRRNDIHKVRKIMRGLGYQFGYCISNIGPNRVTVHEVLNNDTEVKYIYKITSDFKLIEWT